MMPEAESAIEVLGPEDPDVLACLGPPDPAWPARAGEIVRRLRVVLGPADRYLGSLSAEESRELVERLAAAS